MLTRCKNYLFTRKQLQKDNTATFPLQMLYYTTENIQPLKVGNHCTTLQYSLYAQLG